MARIPGKRIGLNAERAMQCVTQHVPAVCWRGTHPWSGAGCLCVCRYVTEPVVISRLVRNRVLVRQVALGAQHCLALTPIGVMSWGVADGGRLGHGDDKDRWDPTRIEAFDDMIVTQVSAGAWHSAAIVQIPPHATGGWVRVLHDAGSLGALQLGWGFVPLTWVCVVAGLHLGRRVLRAVGTAGHFCQPAARRGAWLRGTERHRDLCYVWRVPQRLPHVGWRLHDVGK